MDEVYFLTRVRHTNGVWDKGVEVKDLGTSEKNKEAVLQSYHAFLGAYAYAHDPNTDYVFCSIEKTDGSREYWEKWEKNTTNSESIEE